MSVQQESFEDSLIFNEGPTTLLERFHYVRQLIFSKTRLEFRLLWNKLFQKEDEELGWLLNPYNQQTAKTRTDATMMTSFNKNLDGKERITIYDRSVSTKSDSRRRRRRRRHEDKTLGEKALKIARYMGMGVYMTSTSFPSPFLPMNDTTYYEDIMSIPGPIKIL